MASYGFLIERKVFIFVLYQSYTTVSVCLSALDRHGPCLGDARARVLHKHVSHLHLFREFKSLTCEECLASGI
jgi:hypothetical protein